MLYYLCFSFVEILTMTNSEIKEVFLIFMFGGKRNFLAKWPTTEYIQFTERWRNTYV